MNGLLPYTPIFLLLPFGIHAMYRTRPRHAVLMATLFIGLLYSFAAWHFWSFGCSFGMRPIVQYTPFLALALVDLRVLGTWLRRSVALMMVILCILGYRMTLTFSACFVHDTWDFKAYKELVLDSLKVRP